jgi:NCS1 nucleoside transporter family
MAIATAEPSALEIEERGIQRVPPDARSDHGVRQLGVLWFTVNFVLSSVVTGSLAITVFGLGLWDSLLAILIFNLLGCFAVGYLCTQGPELGLRQITISRFSFGWNGARLLALFNIAACLGWSTVNVIIGGGLFSAVTGWPYWLGVLIIAACTTVVSIYGYQLVHRYEAFAWIPLAVVFLIMTVVAAPHFHNVATPGMSLGFIANWMSYGAAIFGFAIGWSSYAADYSAYMPESTRRSSVFWWTFGGEFLACFLLEALGVLFTTWLPKDGASSSLLVGAVHPLGHVFGDLLLLLLVASVIANNIPNDYSLGLTIQVFGKWWENVRRWIWTLIGAVVYVVAALLLGANVANTLQDFLLLVAYWLGPFATIMILEDFFFRKRQYNAEAWDDPARLPVGWAAVVSFLIGLVGVVLGASQTKYTGPVAKALAGSSYGMDVGFELAVILAGVSYLILRPIELRQSRDREAETPAADAVTA